MAPAHRYLQRAARTKLAKRAGGLAGALEAALFATPGGADGVEWGNCDAVIAQQLRQAEERCEPAFLLDSDGDDARVVTVGLSLLGHPEVLIRWPKVHADAARDIARDLVIEVFNGEGATHLSDGRHCFAARFGLGYRVERSDAPGDQMFGGRLGALTAKWRHAGTPPTVTLRLILDVREGGVLLAGCADAMAIWRKKGGVDVFTGLVKLPVPSVSWDAVGKSFSVASLKDIHGPLDGPCTIATPREFLAIMAEYD